MQKIARFKWSLLLAALGVACEVFAVLSIVQSFRGTGTSFLGPGEATVHIVKPGKYTLWRETRSLIDGQVMSFPDDLPPGAVITILKLPEGASVPLVLDSGASMQGGDQRSVSVADVTLSNPGDYRVVVTGFSGKRSFRLEEAKFLKVFLNVFLAGFVGIGLLLGALVAGIIALIRLSRPAA